MRVLTRSDFDGLGCAVLLREIGLASEIAFVHPKDVQDGKISVTTNDILVNVPYVKGCGLWFDHHSSERERHAYGDFNGACDPEAPSAARVIFDFYGEERFANERLRQMVAAVDKADSANFTAEEILDPQGWVLLSFIMDPRTGLGRYKDYRVSNYQLMEQLVEYCRTMSIEEILRLPDVEERVRRYFEQTAPFQDMLRATTTLQGNVIVTDLRGQEEIFTGNRFIMYSLYPEGNVSVQVMWGMHRQNIVMTVGHSILNRSCKTDVGSLMLRYGGGGHRRVGTCQIPVADADRVLGEIIAALRE